MIFQKILVVLVFLGDLDFLEILDDLGILECLDHLEDLEDLGSYSKHLEYLDCLVCPEQILVVLEDLGHLDLLFPVDLEHPEQIELLDLPGDLEDLGSYLEFLEHPVFLVLLGLL